MTENCREIEPLLSPYLDGELDADARRRVEAHLAECDACRATLEEWRRAENVMRTVKPVRSDVEWERLAQRVEAAIDLEDEKSRAAAAATAPSPRPAGRRWWLWGGSGALVAAALVALFWPWVVPHPNEPPALRRSESAEVMLQKDEAGAPASAPATKPQAEQSQSNATAPASNDARRGLTAPEGMLGETSVTSPLEKKSRADAAQPPEVDAKDKADAPSVSPPPVEAERSNGSYGLVATEESRLEAEKVPAPAAPPQRAAEESRAKSAAPAEPMEAPRAAVPKSLASSGRAAFLDEDRARAAPDSSFVTTASKVEAALTDGRESVLRDAASEVDAFLAAFPQSPHRVEALTDRMRLLARLSALDPDRWCESARLAVDEWQRAAHDPAQELRNVAQEIDERCGGWGN